MQSYKLANINNIIITGHVTKDPGFVEAGKAKFVKFLLANNQYRKSKGEWVEETLFIMVQAFSNPTLEKLQKGDAVLVQGKLRQERWESAEGEKQVRTVIWADKVNILTRHDVEEIQESEEAPEF